jgi:hypothetical protein
MNTTTRRTSQITSRSKAKKRRKQQENRDRTKHDIIMMGTEGVKGGGGVKMGTVVDNENKILTTLPSSKLTLTPPSLLSHSASSSVGLASAQDHSH